MATSTATITSGVALASDSSITRQDIVDAIEDAVVGNFTRAHVASSATIPTIGTSAPTSSPAHVNGELWVDTADPGDGTTTKVHTLKSYNGTAFRPVNSWHVSTTAPTYTASEGMGWWDSTNDLFRVYGTTSGVTGWHPIDNQFQIWFNDDSVTINSGDVVIDYNDGTGTLRNARLPTLEKDGRVIGVALESIAAGANGLIAMLGCQRAVTVNVVNNSGGSSAIAFQHYLVAHASTFGRARTVGNAFLQTPSSTATKVQRGVPFGAFAIAMDTPGSNGNTTCIARLLPAIGAGAYQQMPLNSIATFADDMTDTNLGLGTAVDVDLTAVPDGGSSVLQQASHAPLISVDVALYAQFTKSAAGYAIFKFQIGSNTSVTNDEVYDSHHAGGVSQEVTISAAKMSTPTSDGSTYTKMGNIFYWAGTKTINGGGTLTATVATLKLVGYWY